MIITFEETGADVLYKVSDFDSKYEPILKMCFYEAKDDFYFKRYPVNSKYINKMMKRYAEKANLMFDQLGYFADIPWESGLLKFCEKTKNSNIKWWLTGSCAACIRGIEINPHDIDIMINSQDVEEITELFQDYLIEPVTDTKGWLTRDFGVMFMDVRIDIASDPSPRLDETEPSDCGVFAMNNLETLNWKGYEIKVPPLYLQINVNKKRGRLDRVKKMEEFTTEVKRGIYSNSSQQE